MITFSPVPWSIISSICERTLKSLALHVTSNYQIIYCKQKFELKFFPVSGSVDVDHIAVDLVTVILTINNLK